MRECNRRYTVPKIPKVNNKKTTLLGYLVLVGSVITCLITLLSGGDVMGCITNAIVPALGGAGLIAASDGGH